MIVTINDGRRPTLDRDYQHNLHANAATIEIKRKVAEEAEVSQSDIHQAESALLDEYPEWRQLVKQRAQLIANGNKKYPKDLPPKEPPNLTPVQAYEILDPVIKREYEKIDQEKPKEKKVTRTVAKPLQTTGMDIWTPIEKQLKARVSEENFGHWLSSVRFLSEDTGLLVLLVPNTFFQEYLGEHYTEVIQEELQEKYRLPYRVEFTVMPQEIETIIEEEVAQVPTLLQLITDRGVETLDKLESLENETKPEVYQRRMNAAHRRSGSNEARMAEETAILKGQRLDEEAARVKFRAERRAKFEMMKAGTAKLRQDGNRQYQKQYSKPSHFDTEGPLMRKDLS